MLTQTHGFRVLAVVAAVVGILALADAGPIFAGQDVVAVTVQFAATQGDAATADDLDSAQYAYTTAKGGRDEKLLAKYAQAEWDVAKKKGADAEAKLKAGDTKGAIVAYREAAKAYSDAIALSKVKDNAAKAGPLVDRLNLTKDKFVAQELLAQAEILMASDPQMPALREKVKAMPLPKETTLQIAPKVTLKLVLIPAGKFNMGSPDGEKDRSTDEGPQHEVTISKPFYMAATELTQEQFGVFMWPNPSSFVDPTRPLDQVSYDDAIEYCKKATAKTGKTFRLPTEAEWEYACRAGGKTRFDYGDDDSVLADHAWYKENGDSKTQPVGQKKANAWGLYDMHGNVWEWCADYHGDYDAKANNTDPQGPATGTSRLLRGGSWRCDPRLCRSAYRFINTPDLRCTDFGFRVIVELK